MLESVGTADEVTLPPSHLHFLESYLLFLSLLYPVWQGIQLSLYKKNWGKM